MPRLRLFLTCLIFMGVVCTSDVSFSFDYVVNDFTFYPVSDMPRPQKGASFKDPAFHTTITRITDAPADVPGANNHYAQPGYPKHDIENADGTKLLIQSYGGSTWHIWNAQSPYNKIKDIPVSLIGWGSPIDARWSATDPNILYYHYKGDFIKYNLKDDSIEVIWNSEAEWPIDENEIYVVPTLHEEGDGSMDGRYWAFDMYAKKSYNGVTTYYSKGAVVIDAKTKTRASKILSSAPNWIQNPGYTIMSPSGNWVLFGDMIKRYPRDLSGVVSLAANNHSDVAIDDTGREVIVCAGRYWKDGVDKGVWAKMVDIETGELFWLAPVLNTSYHVSGNCYDKPGWAVFSVYAPSSPEEASKWFHHSVLMYELTRSIPSPDFGNHAKIWRVAHTHTVRKGYADDPFAKINRKGTKIWFGSGWGQSYKEGQYDVYQIDLPPTWYQDLQEDGKYNAYPIIIPSTPDKDPAVENANFFICSYKFNDGDAATIASKYDFIVTGLGKASSVPTMKANNSGLKAIHYDNALTHGDDYFVYDTLTGKKIVHDDWGWYLHDISKAEYRASLGEYIASNLKSYGQFDGVFLDDVWHSLNPSVFHQEGTSEDPHLPADLIDNWRSYMIDLIKVVKSGIGSDLLIVNCSWHQTDYVKEADGLMDEWFAHANWQNPTEFYGASSWKGSIDALIKIVNENKYYLAQSGVSGGASQAEIDKLVRYCFSSFLMAVPSNNKFAKHYFVPSLSYSNYYFYSEWEIQLGNPIKSYYEIPGTGLYRRDFEKGIVLVNPTDTSRKVSLDKKYYSSDGKSMSEVELSDHEGLLLFKDGASPASVKGVKIIAIQ